MNEKNRGKDSPAANAESAQPFPLVDVKAAAHRLVCVRLLPGDHAVDATVGNGADTLMLARGVGAGGRVDGFDVQAEAIESTRRRLADAAVQADVHLHVRGHEHIADIVPRRHHGQVAAAMFNLGYLPGGNHDRATRPETTVAGVTAALHLLRPGGILTVVAYLGHAGGPEEAEAVWSWARSLDPARWGVVEYRVLSAQLPPQLLALEKR